jgi:NADH:ubiquinone reductase (non-electrogenic)
MSIPLKHGFLFLNQVGAPGLLVVGDCAAVLGERFPATAQVAAQQGAYVAHMVNRYKDIGTGM